MKLTKLWLNIRVLSLGSFATSYIRTDINMAHSPKNSSMESTTYSCLVMLSLLATFISNTSSTMATGKIYAEVNAQIKNEARASSLHSLQLEIKYQLFINRAYHEAWGQPAGQKASSNETKDSRRLPFQCGLSLPACPDKNVRLLDKENNYIKFK